MKKLWKYVKGFLVTDYRKVKMAMKMLTNDKIVGWKFNVYYVIVSPIGFILLILASPILLGMLYKTSRSLEIKFKELLSMYLKGMCGISE